MVVTREGRFCSGAKQTAGFFCICYRGAARRGTLRPEGPRASSDRFGSVRRRSTGASGGGSGPVPASHRRREAPSRRGRRPPAPSSSVSSVCLFLSVPNNGLWRSAAVGGGWEGRGVQARVGRRRVGPRPSRRSRGSPSRPGAPDPAPPPCV